MISLINPLNPIVALLVTSHLRAGSASAERVGQGEVGGTRGGGWGHLQDAVHMVAARLGFEKAMVGNCTGRATPCPDCIDKLRKHYSHLAEGWFLTRKAANWALSRCMATNSADYCMLVMSGCGQSHETTYQCQKRTWVQSWSQSLDRNGEKVC